MSKFCRIWSHWSLAIWLTKQHILLRCQIVKWQFNYALAKYQLAKCYLYFYNWPIVGWETVIGVTMAQWICLCQPSCHVPSTPSMLLSFIVNFVLYLSCEKNETKQKRGRVWTIQKTCHMWTVVWPNIVGPADVVQSSKMFWIEDGACHIFQLACSKVLYWGATNSITKRWKRPKEEERELEIGNMKRN